MVNRHIAISKTYLRFIYYYIKTFGPKIIFVYLIKHDGKNR